MNMHKNIKGELTQKVLKQDLSFLYMKTFIDRCHAHGFIPLPFGQRLTLIYIFKIIWGQMSSYNLINIP